MVIVLEVMHGAHLMNAVNGATPKTLKRKKVEEERENPIIEYKANVDPF